MIQADYWVGYMSLWLKARGDLSVELINILPTFVNLIQAFSSWLGTTLAASVSLRALWTFHGVSHSIRISLTKALMYCQFWCLVATIILSVWYVPDGVKFFAFYLGGISGMGSPILVSLRASTLIHL
jgi:ACS family pantothenate transporter-like MFS transporter